MTKQLVTLLMILLAVLVVCSGCATPAPYLEIGVGMKVKASTHRALYDAGSNPTAHMTIGLEFDYGIAVELQHWSHWRDGPPFNDNYEMYKDEIVITWRYGGRHE